MEQRRDFFLEAKQSVPGDDEQWWMRAPRFWTSPRGDGYDLRDPLVRALQGKAGARGEAFSVLRGAWWRIRNWRSPVVQAVDISEDVHDVMSWNYLLRRAGVPDADVRRLNDCLRHNCTCDGCDLANFHRIDLRLVEAGQKAKWKPPHAFERIGGVAE